VHGRDDDIATRRDRAAVMDTGTQASTAAKNARATDRDALRKHWNIEELSPSSFAILLVDPVCRCEGGRSTWIMRRQRLRRDEVRTASDVS
jgi:hypothetical protein